MKQKQSLKDFRDLVSKELLDRDQLLKESRGENNIRIFVKLAAYAGFRIDDLVELMDTRGKAQMIEIVFEKIFALQRYSSGEPVFQIKAH